MSMFSTKLLGQGIRDAGSIGLAATMGYGAGEAFGGEYSGYASGGFGGLAIGAMAFGISKKGGYKERASSLSMRRSVKKDVMSGASSFPGVNDGIGAASGSFSALTNIGGNAINVGLASYGAANFVEQGEYGGYAAIAGSILGAGYGAMPLRHGGPNGFARYSKFLKGD